MLGLAGAGRTAAFCQLTQGERVDTFPTLGHNCDMTECRSFRGQDCMRPLWRRDFHLTRGLIFVVDYPMPV
jgi:hypothetical protein